MNCGEAREYVFAFLDSELETPLSIDLQLHLDGCPDCAREAEIERAIHKRLDHVMDGAVPVFAGRLDGYVFSERQSSAIAALPSIAVNRVVGHSRVRWNRIAAVAASVVIVAGLALWYSLATGPGNALTQLAVGDFEHFLHEGRKLQIESGDRHRVASWLAEKTSLAVLLPTPSDPACKLLGGRKCTLAGRPAAFAVYDMQGTPVSLVVLDVSVVSFEDMREVSHRGVTHLVGRRNGFTIVASRRDSLVYAAVGKLPEKELLCLVTESSYESH
ncbi:MAG: zf-HC2 domain-containing protein [Planctomycetes bacterium]|nr:zf-HC2 domain-containing protein [Planctomycetota bacterium]